MADDSKVIDISNRADFVTQEQFQNVVKDLQNLNQDDEAASDISAVLAQLMATPDEDFAILAPGIMESYKMSLNNANDKLLLVQTLNALGYKAEDLTNSFDDIAAAIDQMGLSVAKRDFLKELILTINNSILETEGIAKRYISIPIELCDERAKIPQYAHISDSGMDVFALEDITVRPGETVLVPTGIKVALAPGYELQVRPKSGRALKTKLRVANTPGTIDQGYRDEIKVIIENIEPPIRDITYEFDDNGEIHIKSIEHGRDYTIGAGEKFAQLVLVEVPKATFYRVDTVANIGEDRKGGFGSTGLT